MNALEWRHVVVRGDAGSVLDHVDLAVPAGTLTTVVGPSGAGKTTLLRVAAGLATPHAGRIINHGRDVTEVPAHGRGIGLLFQQPRLFPNLSVVDNVAFALRTAGVHRSRRAERARSLLEEFGVPHLQHRRVRGLSGGEQQRIALARAMAAEPSILLLDEPLSALDPESRDDLRRVIRQTQQQHRLSMVYVTHDRVEAAEMSDRVAVLLEGKIAQHDTPRAVFERPANRQVARFLGSTNLIDVTVRDGCARINGMRLPTGGADGPATIAIRPEQVRIAATSSLRMRVAEVVYQGTHHRLLLQGHGLELEAFASGVHPPGRSDEVGVELPCGGVWRLPAATQEPEHG
jgi:ABC-type Fe3+/spermidine/putrescine transport system ATPase subunit